MLTLPVRQFQLKASQYLKQLPITLTVYGVPVAIVNTFDEGVNTKAETVSIPENSASISSTPSTPEVEDFGFCQVHFEKGAEYILQLITWEDENGNPLIDKKLACPKCIEKYQNMGRGRVYFI
jgi:hypothetical protein